MSANSETQAPASVHAWQGDGQAGAPPRLAPTMKSPQSQIRRPPSASRSDTWKLVMLVVLFLVWISTASALLFLYMDRYLFPG